MFIYILFASHVAAKANNIRIVVYIGMFGYYYYYLRNVNVVQLKRLLYHTLKHNLIDLTNIFTLQFIFLRFLSIFP